MNRLNEIPSHNAGARLLAKCKKMKMKYKMMIFTSNEIKAQKELENLSVPLDNIKITAKTNEALKFLHFD